MDDFLHFWPNMRRDDMAQSFEYSHGNTWKIFGLTEEDINMPIFWQLSATLYLTGLGHGQTIILHTLNEWGGSGVFWKTFLEISECKQLVIPISLLNVA